MLALLLLPYEIIGVRDVVAGLVAVAVLADKAGHVLHFIPSPGLREQGVELRLDGLLARIQGDDAHRIVRRIEKDVPRIGFAPHVLEIGIIRVEAPDPASVVHPAAVEPGGGVEHLAVVLGLLHQECIIFLISEDLRDLGSGVVVISVLKHFLDTAFALDIERHIDGILVGNPPLFKILVHIAASSAACHGRILEDELVGALEVEIADAAAPGTGDERRSVISVEECGHETAVFLTLVCDGLDDIDGHIRTDESEEDEFVAMVIPERRIRIITETVVHHLSAHVRVLVVAVAPEAGPQERAVESGIEQATLPLGTAFHGNLGQKGFPLLVRCRGDLFKRDPGHFGLQVLASVLDAHEGETDPEFQRTGSGASGEIDHGHGRDGAGVPVTPHACLDHVDLADGIIGNRIEINLSVTVLAACEHVGPFLLKTPFADVVVGTRNVDQKLLAVARAEGIAMIGAAKGGCHLGIHGITVQINLIVSGMCRLGRMGIGRTVIGRIDTAGHGEDRDMTEIPVPLARVGESQDRGIFILIA